MDISSLVQVKLSADTIIKPFKCSEEDLNEFLIEDARNFKKQLLAVTYLLELPQQGITAAYFSILADKIIFNPDDKPSWNKINQVIPNPKRRKTYPAIKLGRLAVNENCTGLGIGTFILNSLKFTFANESRIGCRFITVDALDKAINFYLKNGFQFLSQEDENEPTRLMFFDLKKY